MYFLPGKRLSLVCCCFENWIEKINKFWEQQFAMERSTELGRGDHPIVCVCVCVPACGLGLGGGVQCGRVG